MSEYKILRCTKPECGKLGIFCSGIATKCRYCNRPYKTKTATVIRRGIATPQEAGFILREIGMELLRQEQAKEKASHIVLPSS